MIRRGRKRTKYATRERDYEHMGAVKMLPCCARHLSPCRGLVEADHAGRRGLGRKCEDRETIPLCTGHHRERTDFSGIFRTWTKEEMREWLAEQIVVTQSTVDGRAAALRIPW